MKVYVMHKGELLHETTTEELVSMDHSLGINSSVTIEGKVYFIENTHFNLPEHQINITVSDQPVNEAPL